MPLKTIIIIGMDRLLPMTAAFLYSFILPDTFILSLLKSLLIALIVKVLLIIAAPEIKKWSDKLRFKITALKRLRRINKYKSNY